MRKTTIFPQVALLYHFNRHQIRAEGLSYLKQSPRALSPTGQMLARIQYIYYIQSP